jgi:UDP-N-acetylmuramyl-tripeptide synthetase
MKLTELIQDLPAAQRTGPDCEVRAVSDDSRQIGPGDVFVAVRGLTVDGHDFAPVAVRRGAAALVVDHALPELAVPQVVCPDTARALGWLVARAAGRPADRMVLVGVTGTNGKTTTTYLLESMLAHAGQRPGVIGTVSYRYAGTCAAAPFTTPTPALLHDLLGQMASAGTSHVVMETSSAALAMERLEGISFQVAAFTNLTQDHLDVHATLEAYFAAKTKLFRERLAPGAAAVAMVDDRSGCGQALLSQCPPGTRTFRVSRRGKDAEVVVVSATSSLAGIQATLRTPRGMLDVRSPGLFGDYNVENLALAVAVGEALGLSPGAIAGGIASLPGVPGRVERVRNPHGIDVFVDYAHTPDALERVLAALRPLVRGRLIAVFGCGGDRDRTKRPQMGAIVARDADVAVVTSDNPRTEEPESIIRMIQGGMTGARAKVVVEADRRRAIALAVDEAQPSAGDVILIAGKGHEDYQILGQTKIHFDDREEARAAIAARMER